MLKYNTYWQSPFGTNRIELQVSIGLFDDRHLDNTVSTIKDEFISKL